MKKLLIWTALILGPLASIGQSNNALSFDNIDDFVSVPNASALIAGSNEISMSMWVYPQNNAPAYPDFDGFGGFRNNGSADFYLLQLNSTDVEARFRNDLGTNYDIIFTGLQINTWQHFLLMYDGSNLSLYYNGVLFSSLPASGNISSTTETFFIGKAPWTGAEFYMNGKTDEVSLWNRVLTPQEISCMVSSGINPTSTGLQLYYKCDQGTAGGNNGSITSLTDATGNINGGLNGMALNGNVSNFVTGVTSSSTSISAVLCPGSSYTFGSQTLTSPGTYYETFNGSGGCDSTVQLTLTSPSFNLSVSQSGVTLIAQQPSGPYQWINCVTGLPVQGATSQFFTATANGQYAVVLTSGGCTDTSVCVTVTGINTGISENSGAGISAGPIPFNEELHLSLPEGLTLNVTVTDITGRKIKGLISLKGGMNLIDTSAWPKGIYFISDEAGSIRMRVVKD